MQVRGALFAFHYDSSHVESYILYIFYAYLAIDFYNTYVIVLV